MSIIENILKKVVLDHAVLTQKQQISPSVYKVRLQSENFKTIAFKPGYFLRLGIGIGNDDISFKDKVRSYSVWNINQTEGFIDLAIATESHGIGADWIKNCNVGETVYFKWKKGTFLVDNTANSYVMVGDLSALSHLYMINRNLQNSKQVESIIYSSNINNLFNDIDKTKPFDFYELKDNINAEIIQLTKKIIPKLSGNTMVYIAGDSRLCLALNKYFRKTLNWDTKQIKTKPFWNPEKKGLE